LHGRYHGFQISRQALAGQAEFSLAEAKSESFGEIAKEIAMSTATLDGATPDALS